MELREPQTLGSEPIERRRLDLTAVRTQVAEAEIVGDDEQDIRPRHGRFL
jgi:hypothetical protein